MTEFYPVNREKLIDEYKVPMELLNFGSETS